MGMACPADERECRQLLSTAYAQNHPVAVRYPRGAGVGTEPGRDLDTLPFGKGEVRRQGEKLAILAFGTLLYPALAAGEALDAIASSARIALDEQAGVDLDQEAVNLVRFQQAFQASGKVMQVASDIFDTILAIR